MSKLDFQILGSDFTLDGIAFAPMTALLASSATSVSFSTTGNHTYALTGAFTFDASGALAGGTITGLTYSQGTFFSVLAVSDLAVPVASYVALAKAGDQAGLQALFFGGSDVVTSALAPAGLRTYGGDDVINHGIGASIYDGGDGFDTVIFSGGLAAPQFTRVDGELRVTGATFSADTERLLNIEVIQVGSKTYFNLSGTDATIARLYSAAFARAPDAAGLAVQENALHQGLTPQQLAQNFIASAEFNARYGNVNALSNTQYATALYSNVLGRAPDAAGLAVQIDALDHGLTRPQLLLNFADSAENKTNVTGDWLLA